MDRRIIQLYGGGMVGQVAAAGAEVQAAVVFYGVAPPIEKVPAIKALR
jgi:dienelactone hydrolase